MRFLQLIIMREPAGRFVTANSHYRYTSSRRAVRSRVQRKRYGSPLVNSFMPYKAVERLGSWCLHQDKRLAPGEFPACGGGYPTPAFPRTMAAS